jgi:hypothetical protein
MVREDSEPIFSINREKTKGTTVVLNKYHESEAKRFAELEAKKKK